MRALELVSLFNVISWAQRPPQSTSSQSDGRSWSRCKSYVLCLHAHPGAGLLRNERRMLKMTATTHGVTWRGCQVDEELDADTPNAGKYRFEKMVSGLYMGEVARRVILHLAVGVPSSTSPPPPCALLGLETLWLPDAALHACHATWHLQHLSHARQWWASHITRALVPCAWMSTAPGE